MTNIKTIVAVSKSIDATQASKADFMGGINITSELLLFSK
jgi:hypothetical protein